MINMCIIHFDLFASEYFHILIKWFSINLVGDPAVKYCAIYLLLVTLRMWVILIFLSTVVNIFEIENIR